MKRNQEEGRVLPAAKTLEWMINDPIRLEAEMFAETFLKWNFESQMTHCFLFFIFDFIICLHHPFSGCSTSLFSSFFVCSFIFHHDFVIHRFIYSPFFDFSLYFLFFYCLPPIIIKSAYPLSLLYFQFSFQAFVCGFHLIFLSLLLIYPLFFYFSCSFHFHISLPLPLVY